MRRLSSLGSSSGLIRRLPSSDRPRRSGVHLVYFVGAVQTCLHRYHKPKPLLDTHWNPGIKTLQLYLEVVCVCNASRCWNYVLTSLFIYPHCRVLCPINVLLLLLSQSCPQLPPSQVISHTQLHTLPEDTAAIRSAPAVARSTKGRIFLHVLGPNFPLHVGSSQPHTHSLYEGSAGAEKTSAYNSFCFWFAKV